MTEVATPINYQQQQQTTPVKEGTPNKDSKIYIHTGNIANWTNVKSRRSNDMPTNELNQALYRTLTKHRDQQLGDWDEVFYFLSVCLSEEIIFLFRTMDIKNKKHS